MSRRALILFCLILVVILSSAIWWAARPPFGSGPIDVASLGSFTLDQANGKDADIPPAIRGLDGRRVTLLGEMWQPYSDGNGENVQGFDLERIDQSRGFPVPPHVQAFVRCRISPGRVVTYYPGSVEATGVLHVAVQNDAGRVSSVFRMDVEQVQAEP
jgi:hypothetical protein